MKTLTRKSLDELAKILPVVSIEEQQECWGGGTESCVFNCFAHLGTMSASMYYEKTRDELGYEPDDNGGVPTSDIAKIGALGYLSVKEVKQDSQFTLLANGYTNNGSRVMMTFNKDGIDHAVVVTGFEKKDGVTQLLYHDPTTGNDGERDMKNYSGLYFVDFMYIDSPISVSDPLGLTLDPNQSTYYG